MAKPSLKQVATAVTGSSTSAGLQIPLIQIDPWKNFVRGAAISAQAIDKLALGFKSFKEPLEDSLDKVVIPSIKRNFQAQGRPQWKKLTKKTIYNRLMEGYPPVPILQKVGRLKNNATQKQIWEIKNDMLRLRTVYFDQKVPYAHFHQIGTIYMPARPFIRIASDEEAEIYGIFMAFMVKQVDKHWGEGTF